MLRPEVRGSGPEVAGSTSDVAAEGVTDVCKGMSPYILTEDATVQPQATEVHEHGTGTGTEVEMAIVNTEKTLPQPPKRAAPTLQVVCPCPIY
jgi:hypothetical protein